MATWQSSRAWAEQMIKSELVDWIAAKNPHLYRRDVERIVNAVLREIVEVLRQGGRAELRGFGTFSVRQRQARMGRNPRDGSDVEVHAKRVPHFKAAKEMRERLTSDKQRQCRLRWRFHTEEGCHHSNSCP